MRNTAQLENTALRLTVTLEGGHIAEILHKATGVNPLWSPPWPSIEPSAYDARKHPEYGTGPEAKLLSGIKGHNLCLDLFGGPSEAEAAAGMTVHGEASVNRYKHELSNGELVLRTKLEHAQLGFERRLRLEGTAVHFHETVENLSALDRPIAWTQHVSLGPPFLEPGMKFDLTATKCKAYDTEFGNLYKTGAEFEWKRQEYPNRESFAGYATHLMDPSQTYASFTCRPPASKLSFGYRWKREDFPWCGIWDEHKHREHAPWNRRTVARGMEFGVSPMPETRRQMIERGSLFGVPGYRWIGARKSFSVDYEARFEVAP